MKTPICEICLKSGIMCPGCQEKLSRGEISELDARISKILLELVDKYKVASDFTFVKAIETDALVTIVVGKNEIGRIVGKGGKLIKGLQKELQKKIRVVEDTKDVRRIAQDLVHPARILGINFLYLPDGSVRKKLRIPVEDERRLPANTKVLEGIILDLADETIEIAFE
ncbi:MAG: KH domain-containing protein [Candidatus Methanofastidiosia archaeon]